MVTGNSNTTEGEHSNLLLSEEFNSPEVQELSNILLGMGLDEQEVLLFTERNINLDKFLRFTDEDVEHVGIVDPDKKKALLDGIHQLTASKEEPLKKKTQLVVSEQLSPQEFLAILTYTSAHLKTLCLAMPYVERRLEQIRGNEFLEDMISARHTLSEVAVKGVEQTIQLSQHVQALQQVKESCKPPSKKKPAKNGHLIAAIITATATVFCLMVWKMKSNS